jgi:putative hemolysin
MGEVTGNQGKIGFSIILNKRKKEKMKRIFIFTMILMVLTACTALQVQTPEPAATEILPNMPNPASVYCEQTGNKHEIQTAADGSQPGICTFPDGSTCEEWAYFRGECGPATQASGGSPGGSDATEGDGSGGYMSPGTSEAIADWRGVIKSTEPGAQYDDYFELWTNGQIIYFGIDSMDPAVQAQIKALRNSGKIVHLYGTLFSNVPDYNGSQVQVDRIHVEEQASGGNMPPGATEAIADWWGVIKSNGPGAQYDDYFERQDLGQIIYFGIDTMDPAVKPQIEALRDSGKIVHLYGTLFSNVPDSYGSQIQVDRIEVEEQASGGYMPPGTSEEIADWRGVIKSTEPGSQYDDYFELWTNGQIIYFGVDSIDPAIQVQIKALRNSGKIIHLSGTLFSNVPDYNGSQVQVKRIEVEG